MFFKNLKSKNNQTELHQYPAPTHQIQLPNLFVILLIIESILYSVTFIQPPVAVGICQGLVFPHKGPKIPVSGEISGMESGQSPWSQLGDSGHPDIDGQRTRG
ncbi:hypothetical protein JTE90_009715 [Oedothorax gibbosus]|uniref:Uncharacterized protein n=1 Tax=Oedothorax gibbosus TaxID=931172 RepID=A0AAV6V7V1_9ARAC|nr:hypothetical protein JTE90_009715 [Oedothorax gibbosus]